MKKLMALVLLPLFAIACGGAGVTGPSDPSSPTYPSAGGTLPAWTTAFEGHVVFPPDGVHEVYFGNGYGDDPEVAAYAERALATTNQMTGGRVRYVRSSWSGAKFSFAIAPENIQNPTALAQTALSIEKPTYIIREGHVSVRSREVALTSTSLHEIGHTLFGPGHSDAVGDTMGRREYAGGLWTSNLAFSVSETETWHRMREFGAGATAMSRSETTIVTIIVD